MDALLTLDHLGKTFTNGTRALDRIDLAVAEGEFLSLVGPSGCGKSTLLRIVSGLDKPTEGRFSWPGGVPDARGIGFVFQDATLLPWANVFDNVWLPLRLAHRSRGDAAARIDEALALVGLDGWGSKYPRELSGGMRMRVSIARALVTRPKILLLDEPFAALDEITRFKLNDDLLRLWRDQKWTVLFVTHSVFESVFLSSRVIVMSPRPGRIAADISIPFGPDRAPELRTSAEFGAVARRVSDRLAEVMT